MDIKSLSEVVCSTGPKPGARATQSERMQWRVVNGSGRMANVKCVSEIFELVR